MSVEREVTLTAPDGVTLPDLGSVIDGVSATTRPARELHAIYYDTADLVLARSGATLRYRDGEPGPAWAVQLPREAAGAARSRAKFGYSGRAGEIPAEARDLVRAYVRDRPLVKVGQVRTRRTEIELRDADERLLVEVADDDVTAYVEYVAYAAGAGEIADSETQSTTTAHTAPAHTAPAHTATESTTTVPTATATAAMGNVGDAARSGGEPVRLREVGVEATPTERSRVDLDSVVEATTQRLQQAGFVATDGVPTLARALGARAVDPPEVVVPSLAQESTVGELVRASIGTALTRKIRRHDPGVRLGGDPEDVHQLRVGARRLRSDLQTFAPLLDAVWVVRLRAELRWLGAEAGAVRDCDVLRQRLLGQVDALDDPDALTPVLRYLDREADRERASMLEALRSPRYDALLEALVAAADQPHYAASPPDLADRPAREVVAPLVRKRWRKLRQAVRALPDDPPDAALHNVRILAKRCRYAAEAVAPVIGAEARTFASAMAKVQRVLGDHQDAIVAQEWLYQVAADVPETAGTVQRLVDVQQADRDRARQAWARTWEKASAKKLRRWM